jgi:hypothetical protein
MVDNRINLAIKHLDIALWFFLERHNFSSALKLAGAAEEAFRKALSSKEDFVRDEKRTQLAVTPMMSARGPFVTLDDPEYAAIWAIVRACDNSNRLGLPRTARMLEFDDWFYENVAGCYEEAIQA